MDLKDQLQNLFPDHVAKDPEKTEKPDLWLQESPLECKFERRRGKVNTIIVGSTGAKEDFSELTKQLKNHLSVGGSHKNDQIIIQGDYREEIIALLKGIGYQVKRVGG